MAGLRARRTTVSQVLSHCDQEVYKWQQHGGRKLGITIWLKQVKLLSRVWLFATPWTVAHQAPPTMEFSRQEYWSGLPFSPPGDLPGPGIESGSLARWADALPSKPSGIAKQISYDLSRVEPKKNKKINKQKKSRYREQTDVCQKRGWWGWTK